MMKNIILAFAILSSSFLFSQEDAYKFKEIIKIESPEVLNQGRTGTCWSFATNSFLESELIRKTGKTVDLSEMFNARMTYIDKAYNFVYRQGKANFSEGGLAHDVLNVFKKYGAIPQSVYSGLLKNQTKYDHSKMIEELTTYVNNIVANPKENLKEGWIIGFESILDKYMGSVPEKFVYEGKEYTPKSFAESLDINPDDYITLTSFTHEADYSKFILNIPDNFSNGSYYNLSLDEYMQSITDALGKGFTVALDSDVSEKTFSAQHGLAFLPSEGEEKYYFKGILPEKWVTAEERQKAFEDYSTEDDHLMHIVGLLKDQIGNQYYDVKNSWGTKNLANNGHVYMSLPFIRMKSIAVTMHKDALSDELKQKLNIR